MSRTTRLLLITLLLLAVSACGSKPPAKIGPEGPQQGYTKGQESLRTDEQVTQALDAAQAAFLAEKWGDAVVNANRVLEGAAGPEQFYAALKILGLASCNRRDTRPVAYVWSRMQPADRDSLRRECALNGVSISKSGVATLSPKAL